MKIRKINNDGMEKIVILLSAILIIIFAIIFYAFQVVKLYKDEIIRFLSTPKETNRREENDSEPVKVLEQEVKNEPIVQHPFKVLGQEPHKIVYQSVETKNPVIPEVEKIPITGSYEEIDLNDEAVNVTEEPFPVQQGGISMQIFDSLISDQNAKDHEQKEEMKTALEELKRTDIFARIVEKLPQFESKLEKFINDNDGENKESNN